MMDIDHIFKSKYYISFIEKISRINTIYSNNYKMIGYNFNDNGISSIKFYFVFFSNYFIFSKDNFPIPRLREKFEEYYTIKHDYFLKNKFTAGGGLTFTIKFNENGDIKEGFYFRNQSENSKLIQNIIDLYPKLDIHFADFEAGYGNYVLLQNDKILESKYIYLNNTTKLYPLQKESGILYTQCSSVEISSADIKENNKQKFIALSLDNLIDQSFMNIIPDSISSYAFQNKARLICPATSIKRDINSIYLLFN